MKFVVLLIFNTVYIKNFEFSSFDERIREELRIILQRFYRHCVEKKNSVRNIIIDMVKIYQKTKKSPILRHFVTLISRIL